MLFLDLTLCMGMLDHDTKICVSCAVKWIGVQVGTYSVTIGIYKLTATIVTVVAKTIGTAKVACTYFKILGCV